MGERWKRRLRLAFLWAATLALGAFAVVDAEQHVDLIRPSDARSPDGELRIVSLSDAEVRSGDAVVAFVSGARASDGPITAQVSHRHAEILASDAGRVVVRIPRGLAAGKASLRVYQGQRRSKPHDMIVRSLDRGKIFRDLLGGLALFVMGLRSMSRGLRGFAGQRLRAALSTVTRGNARAAGLGAALGALTQVTPSTSSFVMGLVDARMLSLAPALALLVGTHVGAAAAGALLPLAVTREGLFIVAIGTIWLTAARERRTEATGQLILGVGLLLFGVHLVNAGCRPLMSDPELLSYIRVLGGAGALSVVACFSTGVVLAAALQGPGPAFAIVLGLAQTSGTLDLHHATAILAGTFLGAAVNTAFVSGSARREGRRLAAGNFLLAAFASVIAIAGLPLWSLLADAIVPGVPSEQAFGTAILMPRMGTHLAVSFVGSQLVSALLAMLVVGPVARFVERWRAKETPHGLRDAASERLHLADAVRSQRIGLVDAFELCATGHRKFGVDGELTLKDARDRVEQAFRSVVAAPMPSAEHHRVRRATVAALQLQRAVEDLLHVAERCAERGVVLSERDRSALEAHHRLVLDGIDGLLVSLETGDASNPEQTREREILLNASEAEAREALSRPARSAESAVFRLSIIELVDAYEGVGNHVYRIFESLDPEIG